MTSRRLVLGPLALLIAACASSARTVDRVELEEGTLRAGMDEAEAVALLGPPSYRAVGADGCLYADRFYDVRPEAATVELSWRRPGQIVVAYLRGPIVSSVAVLE